MYRRHTKKGGILAILLIGYFGSIGIATLSDSVVPYFGESLLGFHIDAHGHAGNESSHDEPEHKAADGNVHDHDAETAHEHDKDIHESESDHDHDAEVATGDEHDHEAGTAHKHDEDEHDHNAETAAGDEHDHEAETAHKHDEDEHNHDAETATAHDHKDNLTGSWHIGFIDEWHIVNPAAILGIILACFLPRTKFPHLGHVLLSIWASLFHILMEIGSTVSAGQWFAITGFLFLAVWLPCCISDIVFPLLFVKPGEPLPKHCH